MASKIHTRKSKAQIIDHIDSMLYRAMKEMGQLAVRDRRWAELRMATGRTRLVIADEILGLV